MPVKKDNIVDNAPNKYRHPFGYIKYRLNEVDGKKKLMRELFRSFLWFCAGIVIFIIAVLAYFTKDLPSPEKLAERHMTESTKIYDRTGQIILYEVHGEEKRTVVPLDRISTHLITATISAEDDAFYDHFGLDFSGIARAIIADVKGLSRSQGASTITQQLIKNSVLTNEKTFHRKIKEAILSLELEQRFSKDEILEMYLNEIPYGSNAYGIESAARTFFGKPASELNLAESALLASLPQASTYYSPHGSHTDDLKNRQEWVLDRMAELKYITQAEADAAKEEEVLKRIVPIKTSILAPHFVMYIKEWLADKYGEQVISERGLKVITTMDYEKQQWAEEAIKAGAEKNTVYGAGNAAGVAVDPKTGEILAMVGSKDYFDIENDGNVNVSTSLRQPGSSFKPFAYATAFMKGYGPDTMLFDVKTNFAVSGRDYTPQNYNGSFAGPVSMRNALAQSLNIPAVKTLYLAGINDTIEMARKMGIQSLRDPKNYGLALVLGGGEVTLLEETAAFSVFANDGIKHDTVAVLRVEDTGGNIVYEKKNSQGKRVLPSQIARLTNNVLSDNGARAGVFGSRSALYVDGYKVAAKTGTTQEYRDGWTLGYTPQIAFGVWVGNNDNTPMRGNAAGLNTAAPIWNSFMSKAVSSMPKESFIDPSKVEKPNKTMMSGKHENPIEVRIDRKSKKLAKEGCPDKYTKKKTYARIHSILYYVDIKDPLGPVPDNPKQDPQFEQWEKGVIKWAEDEDIDNDPPTEEDCSRKSKKKHSMNLTPDAGDTIASSPLIIKADVDAESVDDEDDYAKLRQVDFFVEGKLVGSDDNPPYKTSYDLTSDDNGKEIKFEAKAYDEENNLVANAESWVKVELEETL